MERKKMNELKENNRREKYRKRKVKKKQIDAKERWNLAAGITNVLLCLSCKNKPSHTSHEKGRRKKLQQHL